MQGTQQHQHLRLAVGLVVVLAAALVAGCSDDGTTSTPDRRSTTTTRPRPVTGTFAGTVDGSDDYVAVVVGPKGDALAYVTDGGDSVDWVNGLLSGDSVALANDGGATLDAKVTTKHATGTFKRPDSPPLQFTASPVRAPAGLYGSTETFADGEYVGGWVVLPDETQRGAVRRYETPLPAGVSYPLNVADPRIIVPGGTLTPKLVNPATEFSGA